MNTLVTKIETTSGRVYDRRAWMGGDTAPSGFRRANKDYRQLVRFFLRDQLADFREYWKEAPSLDTVRIFWARAKGDAWATFREYRKEGK
jgi:hypothetical protein